jgi:hypothetical protein
MSLVVVCSAVKIRGPFFSPYNWTGSPAQFIRLYNPSPAGSTSGSAKIPPFGGIDISTAGSGAWFAAGIPDFDSESDE